MGGRFLAWVARGRMLLRNMVLAWRRRDGLLKSVKSFSCAGEGGAAGLRPAPAVVPAAGRQQPKPKPKRLWVSAGLAGRCGLAGHAVNPPPGSGPAAGGWAFGRLRSSASQAKRPHPWGLDVAIHGANGPAYPHRLPAGSQLLLLLRLLLVLLLVLLLQLIAGAGRSPAENHPQPSPWMPPGACAGSRQRRTVRWKNRLFGSCSTVPSWPSPVSCSVV